jgi:hypothetical protein
MSYPLLDIYTFGEHLLKSKDIDPVYVVLNNSGWSTELKARWCLAYWCTYHVGVASYVAAHEAPTEYWWTLGEVAQNVKQAPGGGRWPRGKERRHWRGGQAISSFEDLMRRYGKKPEGFVEAVATPVGAPSDDRYDPPWPVGNVPGRGWPALEYKLVAQRVQEHVGFGPWMSFKIADMLEQVFRVPVSFDNAAVFMFKDPKEAALRFWRLKYKLPENARPNDEAEVINKVVAHLQDHFQEFLAPNENRFVGLQEVETILCKWKSHLNGHYPLNNDIEELRAAALEWLPHTRLVRPFVEMGGVGP